MRQLALGLLILLPACANTPAEIHAYCQRWAAKLVTLGTHSNPEAYRQDLISTCMAMKNTPYTSSEPVISSTGWVNPSVAEVDQLRVLGRDKANCIERAYVGQVSKGSNSANVAGYGNAYGAGVSGRQSGNFDSSPAFNNDLFMACMNAAGWELTR